MRLAGDVLPATRIPTRQSAPLVAIAAVALTTLLASSLALASRADAYIYWTGNNGIGRANLDGTGAISSFIPEPGSPGGVAVDGAHVYWANLETGTIGRANLDGTGVNPSFITAPIEGVSGVAVDAAHIYWVSKFADDAPSPDRSAVRARHRRDRTGQPGRVWSGRELHHRD